MKRTITELALFDMLKLSLWNKFPVFNYCSFSDSDWKNVFNLAVKQGVRGLAFDGISRLDESSQPSDELMLMWAANVKMIELRCERNTQTLLALKEELFAKGIRMLLIKGKALAECYPIPSYREYGDIDVYLFDQWDKGNKFLQERGKWIKSTSKHTAYRYSGIPIENHQTFIDLINENDIFCRKRKRAFQEVEDLLHGILSDDTVCYLHDLDIQIPSATFNFVFLLMHAGTHLKGELVIRHICDWACFLVSNKGKYDEAILEKVLCHLKFRNLCFLLTDVAINYVGMSIEYAPSFYHIAKKKNEEDILMDSLFHRFPGVAEVKRNTLWCKWLRFYEKHKRTDLFYKEYLPESILRTMFVWCKKNL